VYGFTTVAGVSRVDRPVGLLAFDSVELKAQRKFMNGSFDITRSGDYIVGSAGTNRLSIWNMKEAVEDFTGIQVPVTDGSSDDSDGESRERDPKRLKKGDRYKGLSPRILSIESDDYFVSGDVQSVSDARVIVGPARGEGGLSYSLRLFDLTAESVVGLFCGSQGKLSIEKQYCVESSSLIFSADGGCGFACCILARDLFAFWVFLGPVIQLLSLSGRRWSVYPAGICACRLRTSTQWPQAIQK
jgi:hypothetical protein